MPRLLDDTIPVPDVVPFMEWDEFWTNIAMVGGAFTFFPGEHITLIGPTGCGKTTLAYNLLQLRTYSVVMASKPDDPSLVRFGRKNNYRMLDTWPEGSRAMAKRYPRRILWPAMKSLSDRYHQRQVIGYALHKIFAEKNWCVYLDEMRYIAKTLKLQAEVELYYLQARALGISLIAASQRPAFIPLEAFDQSTHLFFWNEKDERNLSRIAGISSQSARLIREIIVNLPKHEFLYINASGIMVRSKAPAPTEGG